MKKHVRIAVAGDYSDKISTHVALNEAIAHARPHLPFELDIPWVPTEKIDRDFLATSTFNGYWTAPGSPYQNDEGVYALIRYCRENNVPLYGTCGGFQYMVVEYARHVLGFSDAHHAETDPEASRLVISKLSCSLKGQEEIVTIRDRHSWLYRVLQTDHVAARYYCSYGVNPVFQPVLDQYPFKFTAFSAEGEPRALELKTHRFFNGTLFQPPLDSTAERPNPLLVDFFRHCAT